MAKRKQQADRTVVVGYTRVSTTGQAESGLGLSAQRAAIEAECARRGWTLLTVHEDAGVSGRAIAGRPALTAALASLDGGEAGALVVAKLDRLSRSVHEATGLLDRAVRRGWAVVALDVAVDTSTPSGEAMAGVMSVFAQLERRLIGQRTREALAAKKAQGVQLGRPRSLPDDVRARILGEHQAGAGWSAIARGLEADGVATAQGGARWYPATVRSVVMAERAA